MQLVVMGVLYIAKHLIRRRYPHILSYVMYLSYVSRKTLKTQNPFKPLGETWKGPFTGGPYPSRQSLRESEEKNSRKSPNPGVQNMSHHTQRDLRL